MDRDRTRRYLVTVGPELLPGEPQDAHLAVLSWNDRAEAWIHGQAICGRSVPQGELDAGATVTCRDCLARKAEYERILTGQAKPTTVDRLRAELRTATRHAHEADADRADAQAALLQAQAATLRAQASENRVRAQSVNAHAQVDAVRRLCDLTISASVRAQAIDQARDTLAAIDAISDRRLWPGDDAWGTVWLHGNWRYLTSKMETAAREHAADAVARWNRELRAQDGDPEPVEPEGLRWWREP
ncbi:hypothetical protein [Actinacidiphila acididurans]|uniref:Uncharacterized protein n=1 Tax=Actinacidiphila acididurans TaxID=2784346 RepID=A0ABS2U2V1_9ACTN|nr:hypothetical protein [Actinacidiphila acididurans]MBM9509929.1 hypothetical protein [Actinacidiphila acididurans]